MFVQSARFVDEHRNGNTGQLSIYGQERVDETLRLCKMNLAVHGLEGQISQSNTYYEDPFNAIGQFDYVMANPPFNVNKVDKAKLEGDKRFPFGLPKADNAQLHLDSGVLLGTERKGRAGFVMANSAGDAGGSELEIRKKLIAGEGVDVIVAVASNFFYTVTLPVTLWFLDRGKRGTDREDTVLFIDARKIFNQIDRAHRDWLPEQIEFLANIARLYRSEEWETTDGSLDLMDASFPDGDYVDVPGLCRVATLDEIEKQGWSLNPGRYVGVAAVEDDGIDFRVRLGGTERGTREAQQRGCGSTRPDRHERRGVAGVRALAKRPSERLQIGLEGSFQGRAFRISVAPIIMSRMAPGSSACQGQGHGWPRSKYSTVARRRVEARQPRSRVTRVRRATDSSLARGDTRTVSSS